MSEEKNNAVQQEEIPAVDAKTAKPVKKEKHYITRFNLIVIAILFFYDIILLFSGLCLDSSNSIVVADNPIASLVTGTLGLPAVNVSWNGWAVLLMFCVYLLLGIAAWMLEIRMRRYYDPRKKQKRWVPIYLITIAVVVALWLTMSIVANLHEDSSLQGSFTFFGEALLTGTIISVAIAALIAAFISLFVNFHNIDKPFRMFKNNAEMEAASEAAEAERLKEIEEQNSLANILGTGKKDEGAQGGLGYGAGNGQGGQRNEAQLGTKEHVFPGLTTIDDEALKTGEIEIHEDNMNLVQFTDGLRNYLASEEHIYFDYRTVREFIAGLASSRLIILEGLSGTGKSSLARYFSTYVSEESYFAAVQASWRDRSSILGFYNDFSKSYSETDFLKRLYQMTYQPSHINIMVLDEVNISRVEYYFADFLSVLEYPKDKWQLRIMELPYGFEPPMHLDDGILQIPANTWFIGTANKDDSTYTITDKVYDRAITISFDDRTEPFTPTEKQAPVHVSAKQLNNLFNKAKREDSYRYNTSDHRKFTKLTDYVSDNFGVAFGNRVLNQIISFVPVYVACGGKKEEALDFIFSSKILSKLEGRFEEYVKTGLVELRAMIVKTYGSKDFSMSLKAIDNLLRKL